MKRKTSSKPNVGGMGTSVWGQSVRQMKRRFRRDHREAGRQERCRRGSVPEAKVQGSQKGRGVNKICFKTFEGNRQRLKLDVLILSTF